MPERYKFALVYTYRWHLDQRQPGCCIYNIRRIFIRSIIRQCQYYLHIVNGLQCYSSSYHKCRSGHADRCFGDMRGQHHYLFERYGGRCVEQRHNERGNHRWYHQHISYHKWRGSRYIGDHLYTSIIRLRYGKNCKCEQSAGYYYRHTVGMRGRSKNTQLHAGWRLVVEQQPGYCHC